MGRGENAGDLCFLPYQWPIFVILAMFKLSSANALKFGLSIVLVFGKELTHYQTTKF